MIHSPRESLLAHTLRFFDDCFQLRKNCAAALCQMIQMILVSVRQGYILLRFVKQIQNCLQRPDLPRDPLKAIWCSGDAAVNLENRLSV